MNRKHKVINTANILDKHLAAHAKSVAPSAVVDLNEFLESRLLRPDEITLRISI